MWGNPAHIREKILVIILLLPLFCLHYNTAPDWGDDNFQYLSQARNFSEGNFTNTTGYIYKDYARGMGPPAYPPGFSLLVAACSMFTGGDLYRAAWVVVGLTALMAGFYLFCRLRYNLGFWPALTLVLAFMYNPEMVAFRGEMMSDIPFMAFTLGSVYFYHRYHRHPFYLWLVIAAVFAGFSICIRSVGWVWILAVLLAAFRELFRYRFLFLKKELRPLGIFMGIALGIYMLIQLAWLPVSAGSSYGGQFFNGGVGYLLVHNFPQYFRFWSTYFTDHPAGLIPWIVLLMFGAGFYLKEKKEFGPVAFYLVVHMGLLLLAWPHFSYRYFMPVIPFILYYLFYLLHQGVLFLPLRGLRTGIYLGLIGLFALLYVPEAQKRMQWISGMDAPLCSSCAEAWTQVTSRTAETDVIAFHRPRALYFLTRRSSFILPETRDTVVLVREMQSTGCKYLLIDRVNREYQESAEHLAGQSLLAEQEWGNDRFTLYRLRNNLP